MTKNNAVKKLYEISEEYGIVLTLYVVYRKDIKVFLPIFEKSKDMSVDLLEFSNRSKNGLKRYGINTIWDLIELIENDGLLHIKNIGRKCISEIKTRLLSFCYGNMNERQKIDFWNYVIENNTALNKTV